MAQKIKVQKEWSFYQTYHDSAYILRHDCSKDIPLREIGEKRTYRLFNKSEKEIIVYQVDGGLISVDDVSKCDYAIYTEDDWLYLIELKGADLEHALEQINSTINTLLKRPNIKVKKLNVRIVLSKVRVPNSLETKEKKLKHLLQTYGGGNYIKQSRILEDSI